MTMRRMQAWVQLFIVEYPEYWIVLLCVFAWVALLGPWKQLREGSCATHGGIHLGSIASSAPLVWRSWPVLSATGLHWLCMFFAMMVPTILGGLRLAASRSLWSRRHLAISLALIGYTAPWVVFGLTLEFAWALVPPRWSSVLLVASLFLAAAWQLTWTKRRGLVRCHRDAILAPSGWRADWTCLRYGFLLVRGCLQTCWALMIACTAAGHALWVVVLITAVMWAERFLRVPRLQWSAGALSAAALLVSSGAMAR